MRGLNRTLGFGFCLDGLKVLFGVSWGPAPSQNGHTKPADLGAVLWFRVVCDWRAVLRLLSVAKVVPATSKMPNST